MRRPSRFLQHSATWRNCIALVFFAPLWASCTSDGQLPKPPMSLPYDTQTVGSRIETDLQVAEFNSYQFGFKLGFKPGDAGDRARVSKLAGSVERDKYGKLVQPGAPIALRIRINAQHPSALEGSFSREFIEERANGASDEHFYTVITNVKLKPGVYHLVVENLKRVPELKGTQVTLYLAADPKSTSIPD